MDVVVRIPWRGRSSEIEDEQAEIDNGRENKCSKERPVTVSMRRRGDRSIPHQNNPIDEQRRQNENLISENKLMKYHEIIITPPSTNNECFRNDRNPISNLHQQSQDPYKSKNSQCENPLD
jgi:hypothetical protein